MAKVHKKFTKTCIQIGPIQLAVFAKDSPRSLFLIIVLLLSVTATASKADAGAKAARPRTVISSTNGPGTELFSEYIFATTDAALKLRT